MAQSYRLHDVRGVSGLTAAPDAIFFEVKNNSPNSMADGDSVFWDHGTNADGINVDNVPIAGSQTKEVTTLGGVISPNAIAAAGYGTMIVMGFKSNVKVSGATTDVNAGDLLASGLDTGRLYAATTPAVGKVLAVALSTQTGDSTVAAFIQKM